MAHKALNQWVEFQKTSIDFTAIARGSPAFKAEDAAAAVTGRPGIEVRQAPFPPETNDVFFEGLVGSKVSGSPEQLLSTVMGQVAGKELGIMPQAANLKVKHVEESLVGTHVKAEQIIEGLPIYGSEITLHIDNEGQPYAVTGRPFPEAIGASFRAPRRQHPDPVSVASDYLRLHLEHKEARVEQVALLFEGEFVPSWQIKASTREPFGNWTIFVSVDGEPLAAYNIASALRGEADVFLENPYRGAPIRSRLDNLNAPGPTALQGSYASVINQAGANASSANGAFLYPQSDLHFDEPNLYLFLDACRISFEVLTRVPFSSESFLPKRNFNPMHGFVHDPSAINNAYYSPHDGCLYFGDIEENGVIVRYTSRSRDIVIHEFGHAVSDSICRLGRTWLHTQSRAMSEGYSDYFACSFLNNPVMGDYFMNDAAGFRNCENTRRFPSGYAGEEHYVGEVWAGFLWSLRMDSTIGKSIADVLALESLYFLGPWRTIVQGLEAAILADRKVFPADPSATQGRHENRIRDLFDLRRP